MSEKPKLSVLETLQIVDVLYPWLAKIPDLPTKLRLEEMKDTAPCLTLAQEKGGGKSNFNVIGDYDGELLFSIYFKIDGRDTSSRSFATKVLTYIGAYAETNCSEMPSLGGENTLKKITIIDTPTQIGVDENKLELYQATYSLIYRHKRRN